jgi:hypothetical protein
MCFGRHLVRFLWSSCVNRVIQGDSTVWQDINDMMKTMKVK